jgi:hypothetical protein
VGGPSNIQTPATLVKGRQENVDYNVIAEWFSRAKQTSKPFVAFSSAAESGARMAEDEAKFVDGNMTTILLELSIVTSKRK